VWGEIRKQLTEPRPKKIFVNLKSSCWLRGRTRVRRLNRVRRRPAMSKQWEYQLRIDLGDDFAEAAGRDPNDPAIKPLADILTRHHATMKCQFDAFADYVAEAEKRGT